MSALRFPCTYLVTDRRRLAPEARTLDRELLLLERFLDEAIDAGVDAVQIRERDADAGPLAAMAARVTERARATSTRVLVNDRADVAFAAAADGVHLRADSFAVGRARALDSDWIVGRSIHEAGELVAAAGADYVLFGTVFPSASKPERTPAAGVERLREVVARAGVTPVIAIGGIDPAGARRCIEAGAGGVAAIGLFLPSGHAPGALGVRPAVAALKSAFGAALSGAC